MKNKDAVLVCDCEVFDEDKVKKLKKLMPKEEKVIDTAEFFSVFGDGSRLKILWALRNSEICVCDIAALLNMTKSSISHHLRILKQARLVKFRKVGKMVYYSLSDDHVEGIIDGGFEHIDELY
ncbi:MAG: metalloregulator ArsR/SmtB family transcription factor [Elusimicrobiota bacterium]|jgi:ArsR family transcriptional regulator|nr:metalloregulator ArsR/SmtB family transcription factor [Elusimicrobiota bacterium]